MLISKHYVCHANSLFNPATKLTPAMQMAYIQQPLSCRGAGGSDPTSELAERRYTTAPGGTLEHSCWPQNTKPAMQKAYIQQRIGADYRLKEVGGTGASL